MKKSFTLKHLLFLLSFAFSALCLNAQSDHLVISQVYGGGGNSGATFTNDFIEIFNPTSTTVDVTNWSVQYASATGTSWQATVLSGSIPVGGYFLIQEAKGSGGTTALPAPDVNGVIAMSVSSGKVALVNTSTVLSGNCPTEGVIDFVGFGSATCFESAATSTLSSTTAAIRNSDGCFDTNNNAGDFSTGSPVPRNSASTLHSCSMNSVSVAAGSNAAEPSANGRFIISFSQPTVGSTDIQFSFTGKAVYGTDYTVSFSTGIVSTWNASSTLTVPAGTSEVVVTITPGDDDIVEGDESVSLDLNSVANYSISEASALINITDDDMPTVVVSAADSAAEPGINGSFAITLSDPAPAGGLTVSYSLSGSATSNVDYTDANSGTIVIPEGASSAALQMTTVDDDLFEGTENIHITLTSVSGNFQIKQATDSIDILDNEPAPPVVINEVYGGGGNSGANYKNDFIELYNSSNSAVDLTGWSVQYGSAGGNSWTGKTILSGIIQPQGHFLIQGVAGSGGTSSLPTPDVTGGISLSGTAGKVALVATSKTLQGVCPEDPLIVDLVGYGNANCFESGAAPATTNSTSVSRSPEGFDSDNNSTDFVAGAPTPKNSVVDVTPPAVITLSPSDDATDILTSFTASVNFSENVLRGSGTVTLQKADGTLIKTIDVNNPDIVVSGSSISFDINSLEFNTTYNIHISTGAFTDADANAFGGISGAEWSFTTAATAPKGTLEITYDFNNCTGAVTDGFTQYSITGAQKWQCSYYGHNSADPLTGTAPYGVEMNGYAAGVNNKNEDWLISPSFDLTATSYPLLSFWSRTAFTGTQLQLKVSTDYAGTGNPALATWNDLNGKFPSEVSDAWKSSENINLSSYKSSHTYFAFVYNSSTDDGARWTLDDIRITNSSTPPPPSLTLETTDLQFTFVKAGETADKTVKFIANDLSGNITLSSTGSFLISKDGNIFSSLINYTVAEANNISQIVYIRFAPDASNQSYSGKILFTSDKLTTQSISLKGSSIDPANTLEVVNWNMEWFGSDELGPVDNELQQQNASTMLTTVGADIYGLVEVVDENRLKNVVSDLNAKYGAGTYSYVICNYGSHVNPPEPNGGSIDDAQKEAFVYKTALFSNVTTRPLINGDPSTDSYNYWSSGRYPFLLTADVTLNCVKERINFVLIHAKANTAPVASAYQRRASAANELHDTLNTYFANENVVILGDFNDDLDQSITAGYTTSSYSAFTTDTENFFSPTLALSLDGKKSTVSYNDVIDHVMLSNEMEDNYIPESATILTDIAASINKYGTTTTDHYPVFTRYIFANTTAPLVTSCTPQVTYCSVSSGSYQIPAFAAKDDCSDVVSYSYEVSGATQRSGTGDDASGTFNVGTSTILWTATDSWNNKVICTTMVTVNETPEVNIPSAYALAKGTNPNTVYTGYAPAANLSITANPALGSGPYTFNWVAGSGLVINKGTGTSQTVTVHSSSSGNYVSTLQVTVTDAKGCSVTRTVNISVTDVRSGYKYDKVTVCHDGLSLSISAADVPDHLNHGDNLGSCSLPITNAKTLLNSGVATQADLGNYPNPFTYSTTIKYSVGIESQVSLELFNVYGQHVSTLVQQTQKPGSYAVELKANSLAKGLYFCRLNLVSNQQQSVNSIKIAVE